MPRSASPARVALAIALAAVMLPAQTTWIVDLQNGPGTHFTDFPAAVAASANGDVILLRFVDPALATYQGAAIGHGLTVIGVGGKPGFRNTLSVDFVPAGQQVVLRNVRLAPFTSQGTNVNCHLLIRNNLGSVHLQDIDRDVPGSPFVTLNQFLVQQSPLVTFSDCDLGVFGNARFVDCGLLTMHRCHLSAASTIFPAMVHVDRSELFLTDCVVLGPGTSIGVGPSAVAGCGGTLRLCGTTSVTNGAAFAIDGAFGGTCTQPTQLQVDAGATVGMVRNTVPAPTALPAFGVSCSNNRVLVASVLGEANGVALLAAAMPLHPPTLLFGGQVFLDPNRAIGPIAVVLDAAGRGSVTLQLPAGLPSGLGAWAQGAVIGVAGPQLTPPAVVTLH